MSTFRALGLIAFMMGAVLMTSSASATEEPRHTVVFSAGPIEIRDYAPMILAEVQVAGDMAGAGNRGFRPLAGYIFGDNRTTAGEGSAAIAMTSPVIQERSQAIAMTAPVTQARTEGGAWQVAFIMPAEWSMETLPVPNDPAVGLRAIPARRMAVIRFSGGPNEARFQEKAAELAEFLARRGIEPIGSLVYARYNPPWVPTPLRRNEVMVEIPSDTFALNAP